MANFITFLRFPLLFIYIFGLYSGNTTIKFLCIPFIAIIFFMDTVDGYVARLRGEVSLLGSALDIATDRTLEIVLWVVFSDLKLIPIIIPIIAIVRGTTVDAIRAVGISKGLPAFEQVNHSISRFLVSSRIMRTVYGVTKGLAFILLTLDLSLKSSGSTAVTAAGDLATIISWLAITITVARGVPVLAEGFKLLRTE